MAIVPSLNRTLLGVFLAIAVTTGMDASGLSVFSALPLFPLMLCFWYLERLPRTTMGFTWGHGRDYGLAALYPLAVLAAIAILAVATGAADVSHVDWRKALLKAAQVALGTLVAVILTEEGFFRGWLFASLKRTGQSEGRAVLWSSIAFSLWHLSWVTLTADRLPPAQIPVFILNVVAMGVIWGLMRSTSGSVIVASLSHGVWNGLDYVFFGFGTKAGALGIGKTWLYGPEVGIIGLILNAVFAAALWRWWRRRLSA